MDNDKKSSEEKISFREVSGPEECIMDVIIQQRHNSVLNQNKKTLV
jgi:hypothetical protein